MKEQGFFGEHLIFFSFNERDKVMRILAFVNFLSFEMWIAIRSCKCKYYVKKFLKLKYYTYKIK